MQLRPVTSSPDILIPERTCNPFVGPLRCMISMIQAIWNKIVALICLIFCCRRCCETTEAAERNNPTPTPVYESESEESSEVEIEIASPWRPDLRAYSSPGAKKRLMFRYQDWIRAQEFSNAQSLNLRKLSEAVAKGSGEPAQFARITQKILQEHSGIFTFFRHSIVSDQYPKMESSLVLAVRTGDIEPLMTIVYNS